MNDWKRHDNDTIKKNGWHIYRAYLPAQTFFVSYLGSIKERFKTAAEAKEFVARCDAERVRGEE